MLSMLFTLKSKTKTYSHNYEGALSILKLAKINGAEIWLDSETHYFDTEVMDILLKKVDSETTKDSVNENDNRDTREVLKSKSRDKKQA